MTTSTASRFAVHVGADGFLADFAEWDRHLADRLAEAIGVHLTPGHWEIIWFLREEFFHTGRTPQLRRVSAATGVPVQRLFKLFPGKPAKKMAYIAGLPRPRDSV